MNILRYKEYEGTAEIDMDRCVCRGKILFVNDLIIYEARTPEELQHAFEEAVDDYLETCKEIGKEPQKPLKGVFNVRVSPDLHKKCILRAKTEGVYLNDIAVRALTAYVTSAGVTNHYHYTLVTAENQGMGTGLATGVQAPVFSAIRTANATN